MKSRRIVALVLACLFLVGVVPAYGYQDLNSLKQQQDQVNREIQQKNEILKTKTQEGKNLQQQLESLEGEIKSKEVTLESLQKQLKDAEGRVEAAAKELARAEAAQDNRLAIFRNRVKEIYINGAVDYLQVLLASTSLTDYLVRLELLGKIAAGDRKLLSEIDQERRAIAARKQDLEAQRNNIANLKKRTENERLTLGSRKEDRAQLLVSIEEEKKQLAQALDELEALSEQIGKRIKEIQARAKRKPGPRGTSQLAWPVPGWFDTSSPFGWRVHPILKTKRFHDGTDIPADTGTSVVAVEEGGVISTGWLGGYGNHIVIDHGGGVSSLYAHLLTIAVKEGQEVKRGQVIGRVGSTGLSTGPHLHLSIRIDGEPVDPMKYY